MAESSLSRSSGIYIITNSVNGKRYIGSAVNIPKRWGDHRRLLADAKHHSLKLQRAWVKYGDAAFIFAPLLFCARKDLIFYEQRAIDAYGVYRFGYNMSPTAGSSLGVSASAETRLRQGAAKRGRTLSEEHKAKIGRASLGNKYCLGRKLTEEQKQKLRGWNHSDKAKAQMSAARIGKKFPNRPLPSAETKLKMSLSLKGRVKSPEHLAKIGAAQKGVPKSPEHRKKLSLAKIGYKQAPEHIAKIAAAKRGKKLSPEHIVKRQATRAANRAAKILLI